MRWKPGTAAILGLLGVAAAFFTNYSYQAITAVAPYERIEGQPTIVIDAGHGGFDGGAVGDDGTVEKDINLAIALDLRDLFRINGFKVVMTRESDVSTEDEGLSTTRQRKNSDLHNRMALARSYDNALFLSIHQNKFFRPRYWGAQVFYGPKNEESQSLGAIMQERLVDMVQPENTRQFKPCTDDVYLIYNAPMPALLIECGFLSNPEECAKLKTDSYQRQIAFAIFSATAEYLGLEHSYSQQN